MLRVQRFLPAFRVPAATLWLALATAACATAQDVLPCWAEVQVDHRAHGAVEPVTPTTLADASRVVDARLDAYGVRRTVFTWQTDQLIVGLPEEWATDDVLELIVASGWATFVPVPTGEQPPAAGEAVPAGWEQMFDSEELHSLELSREQQMLTLDLRFSPRASALLAAWSAIPGRQLIVAVDGVVVFSPFVQEPIQEGAMRLVSPEGRKLSWLVSALSFGPLPIELERTSVEPVDGGPCPTDAATAQAG